jgi:phage tail tape-measure protein
MKKLVAIGAILVAAVTLSACSTTQKGAAVGTAAGAVIGGATTGTVPGALVGAAIGGVTGAVAGELVGRYDKDPTRCVWRDRDGTRYLAPCSPNG